MERTKPPKKDKGELTINYSSTAPPNPDSVAMKFAKEVAVNGEDVTVTVESLPQDPEENLREY